MIVLFGILYCISENICMPGKMCLGNSCSSALEFSRTAANVYVYKPNEIISIVKN